MTKSELHLMSKNISLKPYLKRLKTKTELWKTVGLTSFQKPQLPSFLIFSKSVHPRLFYTSFSCSKRSVIYMFHSVCGSSHWLNFDKFLRSPFNNRVANFSWFSMVRNNGYGAQWHSVNYKSTKYLPLLIHYCGHEYDRCKPVLSSSA